jgi:hypothetical protein
MINVAQEKLKEAAFFLKRLSKSAETTMGEEAAAFPYYLNAFLSAGRSVTFVLQVEQKEKYDAWFPGWWENQTSEARDFFNFMKGQRNQVLKEGQATIAYSMEFMPLMKANPAERRQAFAFQCFGPPGVPPPAIPRRVRHFDLNGTPSEVLQTCTEYLRLLESLVTDFLKTYD